MPELPDIEVFSRNLHQRFAGKQLQKISVVNGKKLKDSQQGLSTALEGKKLIEIYRFGKEIRFRFPGDTILGMHLMLTGDLFPFEKKNENKWTIVELCFKGGSGLALTDRMKNANVKLNPENKKGVDALALDYKTLKAILQRKANIKNVLLDQNNILGIGNSYSDEILWRTKISPFSIAAAIPDEKVKELAKAIKQVLKAAVTKIEKKYPDLVQGEVKDFLRIHTKKYGESPTGFAIKTEKRGMLKTFYTDEQVLYE